MTPLDTPLIGTKHGEQPMGFCGCSCGCFCICVCSCPNDDDLEDSDRTIDPIDEDQTRQQQEIVDDWWHFVI